MNDAEIKEELKKVAKDAVAEHMSKFSNAEKKKYEELLVQVALKEKSMASAIGLEKHHLEKIYNQGHILFKAGKYKEAKNIFVALSSFEPEDHRFLAAVAATTHHLKDYDLAIVYYMTWAMLEMKDPLPHYYSSDCYMKLNQPLAATMMLKVSIERCGNRKEYSMLKERASAELKKLEKDLKKTEKVKK